MVTSVIGYSGKNWNVSEQERNETRHVNADQVSESKRRRRKGLLVSFQARGLEARRRASVVEEAQVGVHQSDSQLLAGADDHLVGGGA